MKILAGASCSQVREDPALPFGNCNNYILGQSWQPSLSSLCPAASVGLFSVFTTAACLLARFWLAALYKVSQSILYRVLSTGPSIPQEGIFLGEGDGKSVFLSLGYI